MTKEIAAKNTFFAATQMTPVFYRMHVLVCLKVCLFALTTKFSHLFAWDPLTQRQYFRAVTSDPFLSSCDRMIKVCLYSGLHYVPVS